MKAQGQVYKVFTKEGSGRAAGKTMYSIKLEGDDKYYGCYTTQPNCKAGDMVELEYKQNGNYANADTKTLRVTGSGSAPQQSGGGTAKVNSRDKYWEDKDAYDKQVRQPLICYQSATNSAVQIACAALDKDILALGQKKGDKLENFTKIVNKLRDEIYTSYETAAAKLEAGEKLVDPEKAKVAQLADPTPSTETDEEWVDDDLPF